MNKFVTDDLPQLRLSDPDGLLNFGLLRNQELSLPATTSSTGTSPEKVEQLAVSDRKGAINGIDKGAEKTAADLGLQEQQSSTTWHKLVYVFGSVAFVLLVLVIYLTVKGGYFLDNGKSPTTGNIGLAVQIGEKIPGFTGYWLEPAQPTSSWISQDDILGRATSIVIWSSEDPGIIDLLSKVTRLAPSLKNQPRPVRVITLNLDEDLSRAQSTLKKAGAMELETIWDRHKNAAPEARVSALLRLVDSPRVHLIDERGHLEATGIALEDLIISEKKE